MKRQENESFEAYKKRRKLKNEKLKKQIKGKIIWDNLEKGTHHTKSKREKERQKLKQERKI